MMAKKKVCSEYTEQYVRGLRARLHHLEVSRAAETKRADELNDMLEAARAKEQKDET